MHAVQASKTGTGTAACVRGTLARVQQQAAIYDRTLRVQEEPSDEGAGAGSLLAKVQSTMNDGTGAALVGAEELQKMVVEERRKVFTGTDEEWNALPPEMSRMYKWRCNNHRRVLIVAEYQREEAKLDAAHFGLAATKEAADVHWRMADVGLASYLRSLGKLAVGPKKKDAYVKGDNSMMFAWAAEARGDQAFANMGRLDYGSRFDWTCKASFGAYYNLDVFYGP